MKVISKKILNLLLIVIFIVITLSSCENKNLDKSDNDILINGPTSVNIDSFNTSNKNDSSYNPDKTNNAAYDKLIKQISDEKIVKYKNYGSMLIGTGVFFGKYEQSNKEYWDKIKKK